MPEHHKRMLLKLLQPIEHHFRYVFELPKNVIKKEISLLFPGRFTFWVDIALFEVGEE